MTTFAEIMKEQESERFAHSGMKSHTKKSTRKKGRDVSNSRDFTEMEGSDFDEDLNLALLLSLEQSVASAPLELSNPYSTPSTHLALPAVVESSAVPSTAVFETALELHLENDELLQEAEDELLAHYLQGQERNKVPNHISLHQSYKTFSPLEHDLYYQKYHSIDDDNVEAEETEYDYTEPYRLQGSPPIEPPLLYDPAQRREDKDISFVSKRIPEKRTNSVPIALHHKDFPIAKKSKRPKKMVAPPTLKALSPADFSVNPPLTRTEDSHGYGVVLRALGARNFLVSSYNNSCDLISYLPGRLLFSSSWINKGSIVLFKRRQYQPTKADLVWCYTPAEYQWLQEQGEVKECDPRKILSQELLQKIMDYLDPPSKAAFLNFLHTSINKSK